MILKAKWFNPETSNWEGQHGMFIGTTGFGKTYLASHALEERKYVVVHDAKRTFREKEWIDDRWDVCETVNECAKSKAHRICYSPTRFELRDEEVQERFWEWVLRRGHTTALIDEMTLVAKGRYMPVALLDNYATGREHGNEILACTQQPVEVPNLVFSQSGSYYIFYCALEAHREKIAGFVPIAPDRIAELDKHEYYYYENSWREPVGPCVLEEEPEEEEAAPIA